MYDKIEIKFYKDIYLNQLNTLRTDRRISPMILSDISENFDETASYFCENKDNITFIIKNEDKVLGYLRLKPFSERRRKHGLKLSMAIDFEYRGIGLGSKLIEYSIEYVRRWTYFSNIQLGVLSDNTRAINLYKKYGFKIIGELQHDTLVNGELKNVFIMQLMLSNKK